jgi:tRNA(Ile)-lysidine synthase
VSAPEALAAWALNTTVGQRCELSIQSGARFAVALSGGADSTALLIAAVQRWGASRVVGLHVNHGLQSAADQFEAHTRKLCASQNVRLQTQRVLVERKPRASIEALARTARYAALSRMAISIADEGEGSAHAIGVAQHADDQVESVLLALLRGAGLPGLAGMAPSFLRDGSLFVRPLLSCTSADLRQWLVAQGVAWMDDPSNDDRSLTRNRLRHEVLPALAGLNAGWRRTIARSAVHAADAQALLGELASIDLATTGVAPRIAALQALTKARQANALRFWLASESPAAIPSQAQLLTLLQQVDACRTRAHQIDVRCGSGRIAREGERLRWYNV